MEKKSRTTYTLINMFSNFAGYGLNLLLSFVCRMIFVRCLQQEYLGISGLFTNILSMLSLSELGIGSAIGYALYKPVAEDDQEKIASLMKFYGTAYKVIGCVVAVLGLCAMPFLNVIIREKPAIPDNLYIIYLLYLFQSASSYFFSYRSALLIADQRNYVLTTINYVVVVVQNVIQIAVLLVTGNYMVYLAVQILCGFVTNIIISRKASRDYPYIIQKDIQPLSREEKWALVKNVKALTVTKLSGLLVNSTDNIVITYFNGLVTTGAASNYTLLSGMLGTMLNMVFGSTTASVGNLLAKEDDDTKFHFFRSLDLMSFWLYGWAVVGIVGVSGDLVRLLFGEAYVLPQSIPVILAVNFYMAGMMNVAGTYRHCLGLFRYGQYNLLITAAINIVGDVILGSQYGLFGIFLATAVARLLTNAWYIPYAVFKHGLKRNPVIYFVQYLKYAVLLTAVTVISCLLCHMAKGNLIMVILQKVLICTAIPNAAFYLVFQRTPEFAYLKNKVLTIIGIFVKRLKM